MINIEKKLDTVLLYLKNEQKILNQSIPIPRKEAKLFGRILVLTELETGEWDIIVEHLIDDKFLKKTGEDSFIVTVKGHLFKGYVKAKWYRRVKFWANLLNIIVLTIAAIAGLFWTFYQIKDRVQSKQPSTEEIWQCPK